jgi:anti-sigma factor RsiW
MQCQEFREIADSYLHDELIVETNHSVISHLEHCAECRRELAARRALRANLRRAFINAPENQMRSEFAEHLRAQFQTRASGKRATQVAMVASRSAVRWKRNSWLAVATCVLLGIGFGLLALRQWNSAVRREPIRTELAKSAAGDHQDCAIRFRLAEKPIDLAAAGAKYDPVYLNLTKAVFSVTGGAPPEAEFVEAHSCVFEGRRFGHIVFKYHGRIVSFLVTDSGRTVESNAAEARAMTQQQVTACSQYGGYQVSCFETARHAVFVVSDLSETENVALARALAPSVYAHIARYENG